VGFAWCVRLILGWHEWINDIHDAFSGTQYQGIQFRRSLLDTIPVIGWFLPESFRSPYLTISVCRSSIINIVGSFGVKTSWRTK
jgi:hypothetical protein